MGRFSLDDKHYQLVCNNDDNHLHGGDKGLGKRVWDMHPDSSTNSVKLEYHSADGEQGYPGNVDFSVTFSLDEHGLHCRMEGVPDRVTPINLAQHSYYNLDGVGHSADILQHKLQILAETYLPVDDALIPLGSIEKVQGTIFDFSSMRTIADADPDRLGHDHNLVLAGNRKIDEAATILQSSDAELTLKLVTDQPGIQLYTGKKLNVAIAGHNGATYRSFGGVCLEPQGFPNALNNPEWPSVISTPEKPYQQDLLMRIVNRASS